ncbi:MAG: SDR family NAD(P)-dependent oxidoreductase [Rhodobacteraceae bacterium]|nr:MAG: SDR family NAD(P)-dependent oxidoreductase [Paracoccaceae bacterium]
MRVLITGGASGLGLALTRASLARGDQVCALDIAPCPPDLASSALVWMAHDMACDDPADWDSLAARLAPLGPFDLVILNAGISATGPFEDIPPETHLRVSSVNLQASLQLSALLIRHEAIAQAGRLVFVASLSHFMGYPGAASYAASKDGLVSFARSLRAPLRKQAKIAVQAACPGPMDTPHAALHAPKGSDASRRMDPALVARAILDAGHRRFWILPGTGTKAAAALGRTFPQLSTKLMGRLLFEKLKTDRSQ